MTTKAMHAERFQRMPFGGVDWGLHALMSALVLLGFMSSAARAAVVLEIQMTHLRDGVGYSTGDEVTYSFILDPGASSGAVSSFAGKTSMTWTNGMVFDSVGGSGLAGSFAYDSTVSDDYFSVRSDNLFSLWVWSRKDALMNGFVADGIEISAYFGTPGNSLTFDPSETNATAYFSSRVGTYQASSQSGVDLYISGGSTYGLQVNSLTVSTVPEPSAALFGCLGALYLLRRRRI